MNAKQSRDAESVVRDIRRNTRRKYSAEEKIRIVLEGQLLSFTVAFQPKADTDNLKLRRGFVN